MFPETVESKSRRGLPIVTIEWMFNLVPTIKIVICDDDDPMNASDGLIRANSRDSLLLALSQSRDCTPNMSRANLGSKEHVSYKDNEPSSSRSTHLTSDNTVDRRSKRSRK